MSDKCAVQFETAMEIRRDAVDASPLLPDATETCPLLEAEPAASLFRSKFEQRCKATQTPSGTISNLRSSDEQLAANMMLEVAQNFVVSLL